MTALHPASSVMPLHLFAWFFGGLLASNAIPHLVAGVLGRAFQTPFARPSGVGLSSATTNVLWGAANAIVAWYLLCRVGDFDLRALPDALPFAIGALVMACFAARHFGRFHGGDLRTNAEPHA